MGEGDCRGLKEMNVEFQLNLLSLVGAYGSGVKKKAEWLLKNRYYDWAGSDTHNLAVWEEAIYKKQLTGNVLQFLATHFPK